jgi:hypothetical protein
MLAKLPAEVTKTAGDKSSESQSTLCLRYYYRLSSRTACFHNVWSGVVKIRLSFTVMAGEVRQPIDLKSLERYIDKNVPLIKIPLGLKQVFKTTRRCFDDACTDGAFSSVSANPIPRIRSRMRVARDMSCGNRYTMWSLGGTAQ